MPNCAFYPQLAMLSVSSLLIVILGLKLGVNLEVKLGVWNKIGSKNSVLAFLKCMDRSVLVFLKCMDVSVMVFRKCIDGSNLAHLRFPMQSAPSRFPHSGNSKVPQLLCKKSNKMEYLKQNENYYTLGFFKKGWTQKNTKVKSKQLSQHWP